MQKSWFRHHDLTTEEADQLIHRYTLRNVQAEKTLSADPRYWVVLALLPEGRTEPRVSHQFQNKIWS